MVLTGLFLITNEDEYLFIFFKFFFSFLSFRFTFLWRSFLFSIWTNIEIVIMKYTRIKNMFLYNLQGVGCKIYFYILIRTQDCIIHWDRNILCTQGYLFYRYLESCHKLVTLERNGICRIQHLFKGITKTPKSPSYKEALLGRTLKQY